MDFSALWDPASAAIVIGGTLLATALRAGFADLTATLLVLGGLIRSRFDYPAARAEIAAQVEDMRHDGVLRAEPSKSSDSEIADATGALIRHRSIQAAMAEHARYQRKRLAKRERALRTIYAAAELTPIFGLAGTLLALSQLPEGSASNQDLMGAVGMAVISTLYGLLAAHLLLMPLARWIERAGEREEVDRNLLFDWLAQQLARACSDGGVRDATQPASAAP